LAVEDVVLTVIVEEPEPGAGIEAGLKLTVTSAGCPDALKAIAESNPLEAMVAMVKLVDDPGVIFADLGVDVMAKPGMLLVATVSDTMVVALTPPPVPVIVMMYVPMGVEDVVPMVIVDEPEPGAGMEAGSKLTATPAG
jgi:hypothetical protein